MNKKNLPRICLFGCGYIAAQHAQNLRKLFPSLELYFASNIKSESDAYTERFKGKKAFGSFKEAASSGLFDIAFIATPHAYHTELAILAANNKLDIIIEKPIARNMKEFQSIERAINKNGVRCTVAENYLFKPCIPKIKDYISKGYIGDPLFIELNKTNHDKISGWRSDPVLMGGGALLEGGVHWVNALVSIANSPPIEVIASKPDVDYTTTVPFEDSLLVTVHFENGIVGKLLHSWRIPNSLKGAGLSKIYGTDGVITFESNGLFCCVSGKKRRFSFTNPLDFLGFKSMLRAFIDSYCENKPWQPSMDRIKLELQLVENAYKSLKTKKFERL